MIRSAVIPVVLLAGMSQSVVARAADAALNDAQKLGRSLFTQSCVVCHKKPAIIVPAFGPELSQASANGQTDVMRQVISDGTPRMPGFKYQFQPEQIAAIVEYLKTVPAPTPAQPAAPGPGRREAD